MKKTQHRFLLAVLVAMLAASNVWRAAGAISDSPAQSAEIIRASLVQAQLSLTSDSNESAQLVKEAETAYETRLSDLIAVSNPNADLRVQSAFEDLADSISRGDATSFAAARAQAWTGILAGSYSIVEEAIQSGDGLTAQKWLPLREFRTATRFSRPNVGATVTVESFISGDISTEDALLSVRADVLDTYQARLAESLQDLQTADANGFASRRAELAALVEGYFFILSPAYLEQRGSASLRDAQAAFHDLCTSAIENPQQLNKNLAVIENALNNFRAAPLSPAEQSRRAGQVVRFLSLVPVEYGRGVVDGRVTRDIEIQEAITFHTGAYAAFTDLKDLLDARDHDQTVQADALFESLGTQLSDAGTHKAVASPEAIKSQTEELSALLERLIPEAWLKSGAQGDFDVIASMLDQMLAA